MRVHCLVLSLAILLVACDEETSPLDAGSSDAGTSDAGSADAGSRDAGPPPDGGSPPDAALPWCPSEPWPSAVAAYEDALLDALNVVRAAGRRCGSTSYAATGPLVHDDRLRRAARCHAADMMGMEMVTGTGTDGTFYAERATRAGYDGMTTGAAFGSTLSDTAADASIDSVLTLDGNCAALLDPATTVVGVGVAPMDVGTDGMSRYYEIVGGQ